MLKLDHLTVIAPTLTEGVSHVRDCLDLDVPFGTRHDYMGTHNHRLQLGDRVYLEIVALDPDGRAPGRARWFGLDDQEQVRADWDDGRRLRGWVASSHDIPAIVSKHDNVFGEVVALPFNRPEFAFSISEDGSLPLDGGAPSIIDHRGDPTSMSDIPDMGACLLSLTLEHPHPDVVAKLYRELSLDRPPDVAPGPQIRYRANIMTPSGRRELT
ncbi:VOC family protein [Labrenzia sp. DG1229]|uniref:VOC family protein n=1 Tax=Labrenzia sp. DG1229 TaxID=681847 RepID=UPI000491EB4D|nr:VOC family protein [Labrenzia sp. DG1229]